MEPTLFIFLDGSTWTGEFSGTLQAPSLQALQTWVRTFQLEAYFKESDSLPVPPCWDKYPSLYYQAGKQPQVIYVNFKPAVEQRPKVFGCI